MLFVIWNLTFDIWHLVLIFDIDILIEHVKILILICFIFYMLSWHFVDILTFDILILTLWQIWHWHCGFNTSLSQYHWWILRFYEQSKKNDTDSVVICHGFCGYLSWILWLSGTNIGLRDASASKNRTPFLEKYFSVSL